MWRRAAIGRAASPATLTTARSASWRAPTSPDGRFRRNGACGSLDALVDPSGNRTRWVRDVQGRVTKEIRANGSEIGAGQLHQVDGPLSNDVIAYTYDELGRVTTRTIDGSANTVTWAFDALGRVTSEVNLLGTFGYAYDGASPRLATVTYPNSQTSSYAYFGSSGDHRLQTIHHKYPNGSTLSKFDYTYDAGGNILTWRQQADASAVMWEYGYDGADQLVTAVKKSTDPTPQILQRFAYTYDPAGNRTAEQIDDALTTSSYNNMNQLVSQAPGGMLRFEGTLDEPGAVTIDGKPAIVTGDNRFIGHAAVGTGTSQIEIRAIDPNGNIRVNTYEVSQAGSAKSFAYDANGNMIGDGARTFDWDARNQLIVVEAGPHRTEFGCDGRRQRVRMVKKEDSAVLIDAKSVWCSQQVCEERLADGTTVSRRTLANGEQVGSAARFHTADHLRSVAEVSDSSGTLMGRYTYDPWGRRVLSTGTDATAAAYTGHEMHAPSGLLLAKYRAFDSSIGRWLSQDPIGFDGGPNFYAYVENSPIALIDPFGLQCQEVGKIPLGTWRRHFSDRPVGPLEIINIQVVLASVRVPFVRGGFRPQFQVSCFYEQEIIRERIVGRHYLGLFKCTSSCGEISYEHEFYSEQHMESERFVKRDAIRFSMESVPIGVAAECRRRIR